MVEKIIGAMAGAAIPVATFVFGLSDNEPLGSAVAFAIGIILGAGSIFVVAAIERRRG